MPGKLSALRVAVMAVALFPCVLFSQEMHVPRIMLPLMKTAPVIDGEINEDEWSGAARMEGLGRGKDLTSGKAGFWFGSDGEKLYFAMQSETPPGGQLLKRATPLPGDTNVIEAFNDDSFELVLDPLREDPARRRFYHIIINAAGAMYTMAHTLDGGGEAWRGQWEVANGIIDERWHFEASLRIEDLGMTASDLAQPFGVRICRNWRRTAQSTQTEWSPLGGPYLSPETMPMVTFAETAPVVQVHRLMPADERRMNILVSVRNPHLSPLPLSVEIRSRPSSSAHSESLEEITLAPGERREVSLAGPASPQETIYTMIKVSSGDGENVYYLRDFAWTMDRSEPFFRIDADNEEQIAVDYAYFPYHNTIKTRVNIAAVPEKDKVQNVMLSVRRKGEETVLKENILPELKDYKTAAEIEIPPLQEGEYELVVKLGGVDMAPAVFEFVRHTFPWEGNSLGRSDVLIEPFAPVEIAGKEVKTVLRTHRMSDLCLWEQVTSLETPLMKGPMSIIAVIEGQNVPLQGSGFIVEQSSETRAIVSSDWSAGPLSGSAKAEWDCDGMMKWMFSIEPHEQEVEKLTLRIPLDDTLMPLMHACADGLRFNYAGQTPEGSGVVWDSAKAGKRSIIGTYVPYIWLGAEERGLAVFGENDLGWITDHKAPLQEIVREGDTLYLLLHLIAIPAKIEEARKITVGFQATPVKPMPEDWRRWVFGSPYRVPSHHKVKRISFIGSCYYYGSEDAASEIYPREHDLELWDKFAETRKSGQVDNEYVEEWMRGYGKILDSRAGENEERRQSMLTSYRNHINYTFRMMAGAPEMVNVYTNARGVRFDTPEGQTFLDEWNRQAFPNRKWRYGGGVYYDLDPTESFRDYAMWYYNKMLDTFADSIYWDDIFLTAVFNTVGTDAYELPGGAIQPSSGIFNMRELIRRTAIMKHEKGMEPASMVHMTNTSIAPILSFARMNFTWEDKVGALDFQERYSRDYIRAESIGLQFGNVPFCLWLIKGPDEEKNAWADRTGTGVALTHEIKPNVGTTIFWNMFNKLLDFGYGLPDVTVSQYWREEHPAKVKGSDAVTLVLSKPDNVMVVVSDWGAGGDLELVLDTDKLGLTGKKLAAVNVENDQGLQAGSGPGSIKFSMQKHDFRIIKIKAE